MLGVPRDHEQTLPDSERFYFNNYEYYNEWEVMEYLHDDLSKLRFNCLRKSTTTLVLYDDHSSNYENASDKEARTFEPRPSPFSSEISLSHKSVEDFFYHFAASFHEHNFSKSRADAEQSFRLEEADRYKTQNRQEEYEKIEKFKMQARPEMPYEILIIDFYGHLLLE